MGAKIIRTREKIRTKPGRLRRGWPRLSPVAIGEAITFGKEKRLWGRGSYFGRYWGADNPGDLSTSWKFYLFYLAVLLVLILFLTRLAILTLVFGDKNRDLAEGNRIKLVEIEAKRGKIFDRNGILLADSKETYRLRRGSDVVEISPQTAKELASFGLASEDFEGELGQIFRQVVRVYPFGQILAHVLGYTSAPEAKDLKLSSSPSTKQPVGRGGIEASYDDFLKGVIGKKLIEVDSIGKKVSILGEEEPGDGRDIHLTVDSSLQQMAFEALKKQANRSGSKAGAVVAQNPQSGEILALASWPSFDPVDVGGYLSDQNEPLFNRASQGVYPPGSIFKIATALSGLESGAIGPDTEIEDVGEFKIGNDRFVNWYYLLGGGRDGFLKIDRAIARSNDVFFYRVAERVGLGDLRQMAIKLGFGQKTGIDLPDEALGLVPSEQWKEVTQGASWYLGDTLHLGIGQGFMLATPIQINQLSSFMAAAKMVRPYLVGQIDGRNGAATIKMENKVLQENIVKDENFKIVREGMRQACQKGGTAWPFFDAPYLVGCKTGTAEKAFGNPHAWFTAFAPFDNPTIVLTVIVEDGGEGSSVAAPVAREILDWWFSR